MGSPASAGFFDYKMGTKAVIKSEKKEKVEKLAQVMKGGASVAFVDYTGMGVKAQQELKKRLKEAGAVMLVAKNTLLKIAGEKAGMPEEVLDEKVLAGQTALVVGKEDGVSPIQILGKYLSEFELPKFKAGVVEGQYRNQADLTAIASLPGREELLGQITGAVAGPMYGLIGILQGKIQELIYILDTKSKMAESKI